MGLFTERREKIPQVSVQLQQQRILPQISARQILTLLPAQGAVELTNMLLLFNTKTMQKTKTRKRIPVFKQGREQAAFWHFSQQFFLQPPCSGAQEEGRQAVREELAGLCAPGDAAAVGDPKEPDNAQSLEWS